jgi:hypothetical protein
MAAVSAVLTLMLHQGGLFVDYAGEPGSPGWYGDRIGCQVWAGEAPALQIHPICSFLISLLIGASNEMVMVPIAIPRLGL